MNEDAVIITGARHEAGHAVMRWQLRWPATRLIVRDDGSGFCAGTGRRVDAEEALLVALAGPAAEISMRAGLLDWERSHFGDFGKARHLLTQCVPAKDIDATLRYEFAFACEVLSHDSDLIDAIAERLHDRGEVSARSVAALCREYERRLR